VAEFDSVIPAGGSGTLTAKVKTKATQQGRVSKGVSVRTDSPGAERLTLSVIFTAMPVVSVLPNARLFLNGVQGDEPTSTLVLRRNDGKPLNVTGIETRDAMLEIATTDVTEATTIGRQQAVPGDVLLTATVPSDTVATATNGSLTITTDHPDANEIVVPFSVRLRSLIEARPAQLRLLLEEGNTAGRTTLFRIQHNRNRKFKVTGLEASNPEVFKAQLVDGEFDQQVHSVAVMLLDEVEPGSITARKMETLVISTSDDSQPELRIPVLIEPRKSRRARPARPTQ
jgi:hypothetical protein